MSARLEVRSYRTCFDLERRIHRVDRWRLPVPWGVPLRGVAYALVVLAAILAAGALPGLGAVVEALPLPLRLVVMPVGVAVALFRWRVDGRPAHRALLALVRQMLSSRPAGFRRSGAATAACYVPVSFARDAAGGGTRRARVAGPARVAVRGCGGVERSRRHRPRLVVRPDPSVDLAVDVEVASGELLEVLR